MTATEQSVIEVIRQGGGMARTRDMLASGVHPSVLYRMRDEGSIECVSRGLYQLPGQVLDEPDLATVFKKIPHGVACLISALSIHEITTEIPHAVFVALQRGAEKPRINYPPVRFFWMSGAAYSEGVEIQNKGGVEVPVYSVEKTLADCFKYRNKIGMDVVLEALKFYRERHRFDGNKIMHYAKICRVEKIMRPYLEASL
jgi:predicted transcriptional regulator of viral defense system